MTYQEIKLEERKKAQAFIDEMHKSTSRAVQYKTSHPITDLKDMINQSVERYGEDKVAFLQRFVKGEPFREITYGQLLSDMNALGTAILKRGYDGKRIAVIGENCYQWGLSYLTVVNGVGVVVPLDKELTEHDIEGLIKNAEVEGIIFTKKYVKMMSAIKERGETNLSLYINMNAEENEEFYLSQTKLIEEGKALIEEGDRSYIDHEIDSEKMSILLFTSGTTGIAKGVMHSHRTLCYNLFSAPELLETLDTDVFFSILPMHHTYECTCGFLMPLYKGSTIGYCEGLKYIQKNLQEIRPTFFLAVPLIFESLYKTIWKNIRKQGKEEQVKRIMKLSKATSKVGLNLNKMLLKDITNVFGGRLDIMIAGGAAMDPEVLDFFNSLGITAVQGYGLTECAPMAALNPDKWHKSDSCGYVLPGDEVKLIDVEDGAGEICIKGPNVMQGYYNMPEETAKALVDGWFHTGDIGYVDSDGFLYLTGRKKNVIITRNGKNVFPEELEYKLSKIPYIEECMVWADSNETGQDDTIVATIRPNMEEVAAVIGKENSDNVEMIHDLIKKEVDVLNDELPIFKQIRKVAIKMDEFEKTTGHKIKRFVESNKKC